MHPTAISTFIVHLHGGMMQGTMFTGIVEACLSIVRVEDHATSRRITLEAQPLQDHASIALGSSIAVNGCCLTVAQRQGSWLGFDAVAQTLSLTNLGRLNSGNLVNIERALRLGDRLDGHLVQGHIDATGTIRAITSDDQGNRRIDIEVGAEFARTCITRGSVAIDGVSLTIASLEEHRLSVAIIPHTWQLTTFSRRRVGDAVNLEADMIGKYVQASLRR